MFYVVRKEQIKNTPAPTLYAYQNGRCFYCNRYMRFTTHHPHHPAKGEGFTMDHLFPRSMGYALAGNNVLACRHCNNKKANRMPTNAEVYKAWKLYMDMGRPFIAMVIEVVEKS